MTSGPTQNYLDEDVTSWRPRPVLAGLVRAAASLGPLLVAVAMGVSAAHWFPAARLGLPAAVWLLLVVGASTGVLVLVTNRLRRLVPLSALLRLSLVLPDRVPNRFEVARRTWSPAKLVTDDAAGTADPTSAEWLLTLVGTLAAHDARTRAHGERVQAYAALIGHELGLSREDVDKLSWAALLHDVGKVHVPVEIINKDGLPTDEEWAALQSHPAHGGELVAPLSGWLGPWLDGVEQHHERWDGAGYPSRLAGEGISLAARIIAVADTYDVITSARAYKKPMPAEQARAEITRCSGAQFDPEVVHAFLRVGVGRLRFIAGPSALLAALPGVGSAPAQALSTASTVAQTAGGQVLAAVVSAGVGVSAAVGVGAAVVPPAQAVVAVAPVDAVESAEPSATAAPTSQAPAVPTTAQVAEAPADVVDDGQTASTLGGRTLTTLSSSSTSAVATPVVRPSTSQPSTTPVGTQTRRPTLSPTTLPTAVPTPTLTAAPTSGPTASPTDSPTDGPTGAPTPTSPGTPTGTPTGSPSGSPTGTPTTSPTGSPTASPTASGSPTATPTASSSTPTTPAPSCLSNPTGNHAGEDLRGCNLRGLSLAGNWDGADLRGADLSGAFVGVLSLKNADLRGANLNGLTSISVDLTDADLRGATFDGATFGTLTVTNATWYAGTFTGANAVAVVPLLTRLDRASS